MRRQSARVSCSQFVHRLPKAVKQMMLRHKAALLRAAHERPCRSAHEVPSAERQPAAAHRRHAPRPGAVPAWGMLPGKLLPCRQDFAPGWPPPPRYPGCGGSRALHGVPGRRGCLRGGRGGHLRSWQALPYPSLFARLGSGGKQELLPAVCSLRRQGAGRPALTSLAIKMPLAALTGPDAAHLLTSSGRPPVRFSSPTLPKV